MPPKPCASSAVIIFAYGLLLGALNQRSVRAAGIMATTLDLVWSLGSYGLLLAQALPVNVTGSWVVLIVADVVLIFALVQLYGVWRWRRLKQTGN